MDTIAVALIDALGFTGIWKATEPALVVDTLRKFSTAASEMNKRINSFRGPVKFHAQTVSDTVIFAGAVSEPTDENKHRMVELLVITAAAFSRSALLVPVPLAFRGCITLGDGLLEDGILVGEAVDIAAKLHQRSHAACVWLHDSARGALESGPTTTRHAYWFEYDVPLVTNKVGCCGETVRRALVVNPLAQTFRQAEHDHLVERMKVAFVRGELAGSDGVLEKRAHTLKFLDTCSRTSLEWWAKEVGCPVTELEQRFGGAASSQKCGASAADDEGQSSQ